MNLSAATHSIRRSIRVALLAGILVVLPTLSSAPERANASAGNVPDHAIGQWLYDGYGLGVNPPRYMRSYQNRTCRSGELVKWSPDLYRWNGRAWVLQDGSAPWHSAVTTSSGYCQASYDAAWHAPNGYGTMFQRFGLLQPGYYAIKHYMYWSSLNRTHADWSDTIQVYRTGKRAALDTRPAGSRIPAPRPSAAGAERKAL